MWIITRSPVFSVARKQKQGGVFVTSSFALFKLLDATLHAICTAANQSEVGTGNIQRLLKDEQTFVKKKKTTTKVTGIGTVYQGFTLTDNVGAFLSV